MDRIRKATAEDLKKWVMYQTYYVRAISKGEMKASALYAYLDEAFEKKA